MRKKYFACILAMVLGLTGPVGAFASAAPIAEGKISVSDTTNTLPMPEYADNVTVDFHHMLPGNDSPIETEAFGGEDHVMIIGENGAELHFEFESAEKGRYYMLITYAAVHSSSMPFEMDIIKDGVHCANVKLYRQFERAGEIETDQNQNDIRPDLIEINAFMSAYAKDAEGVSTDPVLFDLSEGKNRLHLSFAAGGIAIKEIVFVKAVPTISYEEYVKTTENNRSDDSAFYKEFQAENTSKVSHPVLYPTYDKSSVDTKPSSPQNLRLNTIGQNNWKSNGQWIEWDFEVPQDGFYTFSFRARQNLVRGISSNRSVYIDNKILFEELKTVSFPYSLNWQYLTLGQEGPYRIYLSQGKHTLKMEAVVGPIGPFITLFEDKILALNHLYRKVLMITGVTPDPFRDYQLEKDIPGLLQELEELSTSLSQLLGEIKICGSEAGSDAYLAEKIVTQLDSFMEKPDTIPSRLAAFQSNISALSSWVLSLKEQPLELDYFVIQKAEKHQDLKGSGFFSQLWFRIESFLSSFVTDYAYLGSAEGQQESLNVWVALGRDQGQIIKDLTDHYFKPQYGVDVNVSLVQQGIIEAIAAGRGPDIALFTPALDSVNLASRGQLADLSQSPYHDQIAARFNRNSLAAYRFQNGVYGYPLQQNFHMLFYRKDIFQELEIEPPATWEEFYEALTVIQKNKLLVGVPVGTPIAPDNSVLDLLLFQNGGSYYRDDYKKSNFDSQQALKAFRQWTEFYTKYSIPQSYDFYNRFRSGEMPLALADYTMYNQLSVAAPEIDGLWEMLEVPGTADSNGSLNRTTSGASLGCYMLKKAQNQEAGFLFLEWFTSAKIQTEYGISVENILGQGGRFATANMEALKNMNWTNEEAKTLSEQLEKVKIPECIPATYYVTRNITNAFRKVVISGENPREALTKYMTDIDNEITRKRVEMGLEE